jgi:Holliday junction resolvase RusA-like endonuclease
MLQLEVAGAPIPWMRPGHRTLTIKDESKTIVYDRQKKEKELARWQLAGQFRRPIFTTPLLVDLTFHMTIPQSATKKLRTQMLNGTYQHMHRPDIDNLVKFILDVMNEVVFADDAQIHALYARKVYSLNPCTLIRIKPSEVLREEKQIITEITDEDTTRECRGTKLHRVNHLAERIEFPTG